MRSRLAVAGTLGKPGFRPGDLYAALSVLPLRRHVIGRGVFVYGLVTSFAIWSFAVGLIVLSAWLETGHAVLVDSDGDSLTRLAVLMTTFVPALTGLLTCAVFGNKRGAALNGAVVLAYPPIGTVFLLGSASSLTCAVVVAILWLVCVAPALRYLRRDPSAGPIVSGAPTLTPPAAR